MAVPRTPPPRPPTSASVPPADPAAAPADPLILTVAAVSAAVRFSAAAAGAAARVLRQNRHGRKGVRQLHGERLVRLILDQQLPFARILGDEPHVDVAAFH